jgi:hypothetical protein
MVGRVLIINIDINRIWCDNPYPLAQQLLLLSMSNWQTILHLLYWIVQLISQLAFKSMGHI